MYERLSPSLYQEPHETGFFKQPKKDEPLSPVTCFIIWVVVSVVCWTVLFAVSGVFRGEG